MTMPSPVYDSAKIKKAIRCYYIDKATCIDNIMCSGTVAREVMEKYIYSGCIPDIGSHVDLLGIILNDLDTSLYDLSMNEKVSRLQAIYREHFVLIDNPCTDLE